MPRPRFVHDEVVRGLEALQAAPGTETSSLTRGFRLLIESGLADALDRGTLYTSSVDEHLTGLLQLLSHLDDGSWTDASTEDPRLATVRATAAALLRQLATEP